MTPATETRNLTMDKKLLFNVIKDQAGTLEKAVLEGTMNSIEASSPEVEIKLLVENEKGILNINDKGKGITTEEELTKHFERFGTPHKDSENKIWARFRMGRGQLFAFGKNTWRTSTFKMEVDIDNWGLKYELTKNLPKVEGCDITVELYENPLTWQYPSIDKFKEQIRKLIEFVDTPVLFNGEQINTSPKNLKWTQEDDCAYYLFGAGDKLKIYNLGAFVKSKYIYETGVGGVIVSKKILDVNFARNDIKSSCEIYRHINKIIKENRVKETKKNKKYTAMSSGQRTALLFDLRDAIQPYNNLKGKRIFKTSQGKWLTLNMIFQNHQPWTFTPNDCRAADKCIEGGKAVCFSESILSDLNYRGKKAAFFDWLLREQLRERKNTNEFGQGVYHWEREEVERAIINKTKTYIAYNETELEEVGSGKCLMDGFSSEYHSIDYNKLTIVEKRILKILQNYSCWEHRLLNIGVSDEANAWTDGETYITLERTFLRKLNLQNKYEIHRLFSILVHELSHDSNTEGTHNHTPEFDARFREIIESRCSPFVYIISFIDSMHRSKIEEKKRKTIDKQKKAEEEVRERLGIAAKKKE